MKPSVLSFASPRTSSVCALMVLLAGSSLRAQPVSVSTFAGSSQGTRDGYRTQALFHLLAGLQRDADGRIWVMEAYLTSFWDVGVGAHRIRIIDADGNVSTYAGSDVPGLVEGPVAQARFRGPSKLVFDQAGNAFVTDRLNHRIRKITPNGIVSTFAGSSEGFVDGHGTAAQFYMPIGIAIDSAENLYVADFGNARIRKITKNGTVTTLAGGDPGDSDGPVATATFNGPNDVAVAGDGTVFVSDWVNGRVRKISHGTVSTIAAGLPYMHTVTVAPDGDIIAVCGGCVSMTKMSASGELRWRYQPQRGFLDGPADSAQFSGFIYDAVVLPGGDLLTIDGGNYAIRRLHMGGSVATIDSLIDLVKTLLPVQAQRPLLATLNAAKDNLERGQRGAALNNLRSFENKVRSQLKGTDATAAEALLDQAEQVIASLQ